MMRMFTLRAPSNIVVAEGIEFSDGRVALRWMSKPASSTWYDDLTELQDVYTACIIEWAGAQ